MKIKKMTKKKTTCNDEKRENVLGTKNVMRDSGTIKDKNNRTLKF